MKKNYASPFKDYFLGNWLPQNPGLNVGKYLLKFFSIPWGIMLNCPLHVLFRLKPFCSSKNPVDAHIILGLWLCIITVNVFTEQPPVTFNFSANITVLIKCSLSHSLHVSLTPWKPSFHWQLDTWSSSTLGSMPGQRMIVVMCPDFKNASTTVCLWSNECQHVKDLLTWLFLLFPKDL